MIAQQGPSRQPGGSGWDQWTIMMRDGLIKRESFPHFEENDPPPGALDWEWFCQAVDNVMLIDYNNGPIPTQHVLSQNKLFWKTIILRKQAIKNDTCISSSTAHSW